METWFTAGFMVGLILFALYLLNHIFNRYLSKHQDKKETGANHKEEGDEKNEVSSAIGFSGD